MANNNKKKKKQKEVNPNKNKKRLDISAIGIIDNIVFSKTDVWAYYQMSNDVYDFLSHDQKVRLGLKITNALNNLMGDRQEPLEGHLIVTSVPVDVDAWEAQIREISKSWENGPGFNDYVKDQINFLKQKEYHKKVAILGINIGKRGALDTENLNVFEAGFSGAMETIKNWLNSILQVPTEAISAPEEDTARKKEADLFRTLSVGHLKARRCTSEELLLLIKRSFYPSMPAPYLDVDHETRIGPGDLELEVASSIENKYRWMKFIQMYDDMEFIGYRATMTFAKMPKETFYPNGFPFLYFPAKLNAPFTCFSRFRLLPNQKVKTQLEKKKKEHVDEIQNIAEGQDEYRSVVEGYPAEVAQSLDDIQTMTEMLAQDKTPWVEGTYRIVVEAPTEELLKEYCSNLKQSYDDLGIHVQWTAGDQAKMFLEQMPGDKIRSTAFKQIANLNILSTSGMNFSSDVGDRIFGTD